MNIVVVAHTNGGAKIRSEHQGKSEVAGRIYDLMNLSGAGDAIIRIDIFPYGEGSFTSAQWHSLARDTEAIRPGLVSSQINEG